MVHTKLSPAQAEMVDWALDPMTDYADDEDCDYMPEDLPSLEDDVLTWPTKDTNVVEDMLYRLEEQLPDMNPMTDGAEHMLYLRTVKHAAQAAVKIRTSTGRE